MILRLQKYLALCGIASRRVCEDIISSGKVYVNGKIVYHPYIRIDDEKDDVVYQGKKVEICNELVYIMLNKPLKVVSTMKDEKGRKCLIDVVKVQERIFPIGRLDYMTTGLLLLTNDGDIYNKIIHPRSEIAKTYRLETNLYLSNLDCERLERGISFKGVKYGRCKIEIISKNIYNITIYEGKNRQIRNMIESLNKRVVSLKRISIGDLNIYDLPCGKWRYLTKSEINYLRGLKANDV